MLQRPDLLRRQDRAGAGYRSGIRLRDHSGTGSGTWQDRAGAGSQREQAPGSLWDRFWDVAGSLWGRIAARSGSRIAPGQDLGRGRIALGQDRSGIRLQDRCGGRIVAVAGSDPVPERSGAPYRNIYIDIHI